MTEPQSKKAAQDNRLTTIMALQIVLTAAMVFLAGWFVGQDAFRKKQIKNLSASQKEIVSNIGDVRAYLEIPDEVEPTP